jgi:glycerol-3-phosphate dehydrogenase (NAD+)
MLLDQMPGRPLVGILLLTICFLASGFIRRGNHQRLLDGKKIFSRSVRNFYMTTHNPDTKFAIMGGGAFSLALAKVLSSKNIPSNLLVRNQTVADHINEHRYHPKYLTDSFLPHHIRATCDPREALTNVNYIIHAVPMQQSRQFLQTVKNFMPDDVPILSVTKGVEQSTFCLMNDVIVETLGPERRAAYLSGPSFAKEIMNGKATAVVIASSDDSLASELAEILSSVEFRCHTSRDVKVRLFFLLYHSSPEK